MIRLVPNALTLARVAVVPAVVALLFVPGEMARWAALALFLVASITDYFDGWIARKFNVQSRFGTMLDPIADKLLVAAVLIMMIARGVVTGVDIIAILLILGREILISGLREFLAGDKITMPVSALAKWKTAAQMVAIIALLAAGAHDMLRAFALVALWISAALSVWTGAQYLAAASRHLRQEGAA